MSIAICFNNKNPKPWQELLQQKLQGTTIEIYPDIVDKTKVTFALCWKAGKNILSEFPNLRVDHITQNQILPKDIVVTRIIDENLSQDMFEFVLTNIMSCIKKIPVYYKDQQHQVWSQKQYKTIQTTSIGILGLGKIGGYVAMNLSRMGFEVNGWSKSQKNFKDISCFHGEDGFLQVLSKSTIVVNILPLTPSTEDILNLNALQKIPKGGFLINVGRAEHLVDADLIILLENNHLSGACLDVFRQESLPKNHVFWGHHKISITPHIAGLTNIDTALSIVVQNYLNHKNEFELSHTVSLKKGY